jgi:hypothetical protein
MNNAKLHAIRELAILSTTVPDALVLDFKEEIIALCDAFGNSGQSGGTIYYTLAAILQCLELLLKFETLTPLTGAEDEWIDVSDMYSDDGHWQNKRDPRVFKDGIGQSCCVEAIRFNGDIGGAFFGYIMVADQCVTSAQPIPSFPFQPRTFTVEVVDQRWQDEECTVPNPEGDFWTHTIVDPEQLKTVFAYYKQSFSHAES